MTPTWMSRPVRMTSNQLTAATTGVSQTIHQTTIPVPKPKTPRHKIHQPKRFLELTPVKAHREKHPPWDQTHWPRIPPDTTPRKRRNPHHREEREFPSTLHTADSTDPQASQLYEEQYRPGSHHLMHIDNSDFNSTYVDNRDHFM